MKINPCPKCGSRALIAETVFTTTRYLILKEDDTGDQIDNVGKYRVKRIICQNCDAVRTDISAARFRRHWESG